MNMEKKNIVLLKEIADTLYEILPKTSFTQVLDDNDYTLTEVINDIKSKLDQKAEDSNLQAVIQKLDELIQDVPEEFNSLKKIADYVDLNSEASTMSVALNDKVDNKTFNDTLTDLKNEINQSLESTVLVSEGTISPEDIKNGQMWFEIVTTE